MQQAMTGPRAAAPAGVTIAVIALIAAGVTLSLAVFHPGYMTIDALWVYEAITRGLGDWQSPVMSVLWRVIDPIAPGAMSMFLLMALLYWGGFAIVALTVARRAPWLGVLTALLAFAPPAFMFVGMIWRDVLFADIWLAAAALSYAVADRRLTWRVPVQTLAFMLVALGVLLRPNAIVVAPLLATYVLWPAAFHWKRAAILLLPGIVAGYALVHTVYYTLLQVERLHPLHSVLVFDLGGITHYSGGNRFPVEFTPEQTELLLTGCYNPQRWDHYWHMPPCEFVMKRLDAKPDKIFGTPRLTEAWWRAVSGHPLAYLKHRATVFWTFLGESNLVIPVLDLDHPSRLVHAQNPFFMTLVGVHDVLQPTWLFRLGLWFALALVVCAVSWRWRATPSGAFALGVASAGVTYLSTFFVFGVASDFRYGYWCVLASLTGAVAAMAARRDALSARA